MGLQHTAATLGGILAKPNPLLWAGAGANFLGKFFANRSEHNRQDDLRRRMLRNLSPLEAEVMAYRMAPTQGEGALINQAGQTAVGQVAGSGLGRSTLTQAAATGAVAPILAQHEQNVYGRLENIAAQKNQIYQSTSPPGTGAALGGFLGEAGDLLTGVAGQQDYMGQLEQLVNKLRTGYKTGSAGGATMPGMSPMGDGQQPLGQTPQQYLPGAPPDLGAELNGGWDDPEGFVYGFHDALSRRRRGRSMSYAVP
jgi:hypothetical protein